MISIKWGEIRYLTGISILEIVKNAKYSCALEIINTDETSDVFITRHIYRLIL